ncbi:hypothetical protein OH491_09450 [Termitidicoccus mucosus]
MWKRAAVPTPLAAPDIGCSSEDCGGSVGGDDFADGVTAGVGNVEVARCVDGESVRCVELRGEAGEGECADGARGDIDFLDDVVTRVGDVERRARRVDDDGGGCVESGREGGDGAVCCDFADGVIVGVGDVEVAVGIGGGSVW